MNAKNVDIKKRTKQIKNNIKKQTNKQKKRWYRMFGGKEEERRW